MKLRIYNKTLDPNIWNEGKVLKPEVKDALLKIAEDFYKNTDLTGDIHNILFLGSSANFNWTPYSDIDLHIIIDITDQNINKEYARKFMDSLSFKWNTDHDLKVKGHPVEVYLQDISEPNSSPELARPGASIYSIYDDKWLLEPNPQNIKVDAHKIRKKYQDIKARIDQLIQTEDVEKLKALMTSIRNYRNAGMMTAGEFSIENIVFKSLRHGGALEKLKTAVTDIYDRKASLPEEGNRPSYKKTQPLNEIDKTKLFLIIGTVNDDDLSVKSVVDYDGSAGHTRIMHGPEWGVAWRYKSKTHAVYMRSDDPIDEKVKDAILDHLHTKYDIINPHFDSSSWNGSYGSAHFVNEHLINKSANLYLGVIKRSNLKVVGTDVPSDESNVWGEYTHNDFLMDLGREWDLYDEEFIPWRYKRSENSIYWWYSRTHPNEEEKMAVKDWLVNNAKANPNPTQKWISLSYDIVKRHPDYKQNRWDSHDPSTDN